MNEYEEEVLAYVTARRSRFVSPQFAIPYVAMRGGSAPDFVVADFEAKKIYVVEVTTASTMYRIVGRLDERETRWFAPLRTHFAKLEPCFRNWGWHATVFVRDEIVDGLSRKASNWTDVSVKSLNLVLFGWNWTRDTNGEPVNAME